MSRPLRLESPGALWPALKSGCLSPTRMAAMHRPGISSCAVLLMLLATGCSEASNSKYPSMAAARTDRAVERGWVPDILPDSASDIVENHSVDIGGGSGEFRFAPIDRLRFKERLMPMGGAELRKLERSQVHLLDEGYQFYSVPGFRIAIHWEKCAGRFWTHQPG
jgi:hypothetical protein